MLDNNQKHKEKTEKQSEKVFFHDTPSLQTLFAESSVKQLAEVQYLCSENSQKKKQASNLAELEQMSGRMWRENFTTENSKAVQRKPESLVAARE